MKKRNWVVGLIGGWVVGLLVVSCQLLVVSLPQAEAAVVGQTDDPMTIGGGARPLGMGRAFAAVADDADAPFINPAGIASLKKPQAMTMFTNLFGDIYYTELAGAIPSVYGTFGVGYVATGVGQLLAGSPEAYTDYYDTLFLLTYSTPLSRFFEYGRNIFVGLNAKVISRGWTGGINQFASGTSADFGVKYILSETISLGYNRQNFLPASLGGVLHWKHGTDEVFAGVHKLGVAIRPPGLNRRLLLAFDTDIPAASGRPTTLHLGCEWKQSDYVALRAGLEQLVDPASPTQTSWSPTFGTSLAYAGIRVDYAYHPYYNDPALATSYVSLCFQSEPWFALKGRVE